MSEKGFVYILKDTHFKRGVKIGRARCRRRYSGGNGRRRSVPHRGDGLHRSVLLRGGGCT